MNGLLLIDKPEGWTSFDVVNYVRKMVARLEGKKPRNVKVGHIGTLDPAATGLLVLCVGKATKRVQELMKQDKTYQVELTLGVESTTGDKEGELSAVSDSIPSEAEILDTLESFVGEIEQIPPAYSAIKINGKRAYDLAREGKQVTLPSRKVVIYWIRNMQYAYPKIMFETKVSSGTYIRSLASDVGRKTDTGAYMSALRRTTIGEFELEKAYTVSELTDEILQKTLVENS